VVPALFGIKAFRRFAFRSTVANGDHLSRGPLALGQAGEVHGGDRLPWIANAAGSKDNFAPLTALEWQVHVYGEPSPELSSTCQKRNLMLHAFPWQPGMDQAGLMRDALYLVRPDGHVALADARAKASQLVACLDRWHIRTPAPSQQRDAA
jgi:hypothetical protein